MEPNSQEIYLEQLLEVNRVLVNAQLLSDPIRIKELVWEATVLLSNFFRKGPGQSFKAYEIVTLLRDFGNQSCKETEIKFSLNFDIDEFTLGREIVFHIFQVFRWTMRIMKSDTETRNIHTNAVFKESQLTLTIKDDGKVADNKVESNALTELSCQARDLGGEVHFSEQEGWVVELRLAL